MNNYIQYASGFQKDDISILDIRKAITDIQQIDEEHGAFWVSVIHEDESIIESNKDLLISVVFGGKEIKYQARSWDEVEELYELLLNQNFDEIRFRIS